jgi:TatD DNase family protein
MKLVDSHCHLDMIDDPEGVVAQAREAGVATIVSIGIDVASSWLAVGLAGRLEGVYATVGLHPHEADALDDVVLGELEVLAGQPGVLAVGEVGLDYYRDFSPRAAQRRAFSAQIDLARRVGLPLVVHVRAAGDEAMRVLADEAADLTVVMHCFSLPQYVDECNARGYYASFAGNVTFKNAGELRAAAAGVRDDRIMVETDAPFLTPVPHRGDSNVPAWVAHTAAVVGEARGWNLEHVAETTTANARRAFGLPAGG